MQASEPEWNLGQSYGSNFALEARRGKVCGMLRLALFMAFVAVVAFGQKGDGTFSCERRTDFFPKAPLVFRLVNDPAEIAKIKARPVLTFRDFRSFEIKQVEFYRGKVHVSDGGPMDYSDSLQLGLHTITAENDTWYELEPSTTDQTKTIFPSDLLNIQDVPHDDESTGPERTSTGEAAR